MNLIQVQERLKSLPSSPQTMQALMAYANGMNPAVPPYLALGELNRRKQLMEEAQQQQAGQPPQGTVKDQIAQTAGVMALQQGRQQQAMQQMAQGMGQMPGRVPPQTAAAGPVQMASGGIVALKAGSQGEAVEEDDDDDDGEGTPSAPSVPTDARSALAMLQAMALKRQAEGAPKYVSPIEQEEELIKKYPERFAALKEPVGVASLKRLDEMEAARRAEIAKQREEAARLRPSTLQQLGQAAMASRGQYGRSALASILGGYSDIASKTEADAVKQEQALRGRELELQQVRMEALNKIDEIKRARADGDLKREAQAKADFAKLLKDHNVSVNTLLGNQLRATSSLAGAERRAEAMEKSAQTRAEATRYAANRPQKPTDQANALRIYGADIRRKNPGMSEGEVEAQALDRYLQARQQAPLAGVEQRTTADADRALGEVRYSKAFRDFAKGYPSTLDAEQAFRDLYRSNNLPTSLRGAAKPAAPAPAAAPAANANTVTVGGKTYTFPTKEAADQFKAAAGVK